MNASMQAEGVTKDVLRDLQILAESAAHPTMNHPAIRAQAEYIMEKYGFKNPYEKKEKG